MESVGQAQPEHWNFITADLEARGPKAGDYRREALAIHELASRMLENPDEVLPRFVELAMDLTHGTSAGLSLCDRTSDQLRWHHLRGKLASLSGFAFPRRSPCGLAMMTGRPQLSAYPERKFGWMAAAEISLPEVLHIPLHLDNEEQLGVLWVSSENPGHFDNDDVRAAQELASFASIALRMSRTESSLREALGEQERLAGEMSHRVKNVLTVVDALVRVTARNSETAKDMARNLSGRLQALSKAQSLARSSGPGLATYASSDFSELVKTITRPYEDETSAAGTRFTILGPALTCGERTAFYFGLLLHELATNAAKYGALSVDEGCVSVDWQIEGDVVFLEWIEIGGPEIENPPGRSGFGSQLVTDVVVNRLKGTFIAEWLPSGLHVSAKIPRTGFAE